MITADNPPAAYPTFDLPGLREGEWLRDAGIRQTAANNEEYVARFNAAADWLLAAKGEVTSDDIVRLAGMPDGHANAVGSAMRGFAKSRGLRVSHYTKSTRPSCHAAVVAVWIRGEK